MADDLALLQVELTAALDGLSSRETQLTPVQHPGKWCIQEIVEHLQLSYQATAPAMRARTRKGSPTLTQPTLGQHLARFTIFTLGYFPGGRQAPAEVSPRRADCLRSGPELARRLCTELASLDEICAEAEAIFGARRAMTHKALGPLSVAQWRRFHLMHGRHHLRQVRAIRTDHGR